MKISELKQPYRRMAEYLAEKNTDKRFYDKELLIYSFYWHKTNYKFWNEVYCNNHPEITEEIKKYFPPDFDFSGEEVKTKPVMQMLDAETQKTIYTQLAKEGRFNELPDTCEFSEPVELEVWDNELMEPVITNVLGKFKGLYVTEANLCWKYAKTIKK
jgi:hypothetical protein